MISSLRGKVLFKQPPELMIEVNGVGYELQASMNVFYALPLEPEVEVVIYTHLAVREDAHTLYGFVSLDERSTFRQLLKVNGVGPKLALAIVSGMTPIELYQIIHAADITALSRIPGVGKKTAERLVVELKDRLPKPADNALTNAPLRTSSADPANEALNALLALGYKAPQAEKMIEAYKDQGLSVEEMIRQALRSSLK
ncbi:MAG: Holliday junction branch migration protein RuvA [Thiofilum sp.]|uniref:Holliday junction branch migration protein RuvA n=1 Tax=Thiofilum sp. TaxID=2212733 RepID=UPI0025FB8C7C|nr:Holliday junction branch migration protein RuvA [Thiofilum sp.]MBK8453080.1 Holliday junction branch migration protein RuvA [Thiofilum sp.]